MLDRAYSWLHIKAVDPDRRVISGLATTPDVDRQGHVVEPTGVTFKNPLPLLLFHDREKPVGTATFGKATAKGVPFTATIASVTEPGTLRDRTEEAWQSIKAGLLTAVSIGFVALKDGVKYIAETDTLHWNAIEVVELSLVTVPANHAATITSIKSLDQPHLAALGTGSTGLTTPAVAGTLRATARGNRPMKTIAEQIAALEAKRVATNDALLAIQQKALEEGRTKDPQEKEQFDTFTAEVKAIDAELIDLREMEKLQIKAAVPVTPPATTPVQSSSDLRGGTPTIRVQSALPPGIGFARAVKCSVVSRLDSRSIIDVAKQMYPSDDRLLAHVTHVTNLPNVLAQIKAAVPAATTTDTTWAGALVDPTNLASEFIEFLRPMTIIGRLNLRRVPFNIRIIEQTQGGTGYWVGQGAPKPLTAFGFAPITLTFTKVAAISVITQEIARFSSPSAEMLVRNGLVDALVERIDRDLLDPAEAGTANVQPASLTNGLTALSSAGPTADNVRTDIANLVQAIRGANIRGPIALVMPDALVTALAFQVNSLGQSEFPDLTADGGTIRGIRVVASQYLANESGFGNMVVAIAESEVLLADDGQVTVDASQEASLQMLDNPTNNSATATPTTMVSMWQTNSIALRAERFINWRKRRAEAVAYMDDVNWGSIGSP